MNKLILFFYAAIFQIGWFVCILAGNWYSGLYTALFVCFHLWNTHKQNQTLTIELQWLSLVFAIGSLLELISFSTGLLHNTASQLVGALIFPPFWLLCLWMQFAIALRTCLSFLLRHQVWGYLITIVAIPLNYYAGAMLNPEVTINGPLMVSLAYITVLWLFVIWLLNLAKTFYFEDMFHAR